MRGAWHRRDPEKRYCRQVVGTGPGYQRTGEACTAQRMKSKQSLQKRVRSSFQLLRTRFCACGIQRRSPSQGGFSMRPYDGKGLLRRCRWPLRRVLISRLTFPFFLLLFQGLQSQPDQLDSCL